MTRLWIGHVDINTMRPQRDTAAWVQPADNETLVATNELRQVGPVNNGFRHLAGTFGTKKEATAAVNAYAREVRQR